MRENLEKLLAYTPPAPEYLNLSTNENFLIKDIELMNLTLEQAMGIHTFRQYGQSAHTELREKYANYIGTSPEEILPAPGSESLIAVLLNAFATNAVATFDTDFFRYEEMAYILGKKHFSIPISRGIKGLIDATKNATVNLIILSNPNNPLGIVHSEAMLIELLENTDAYLVIDEAYGEYYGKSVVNLIHKYPKLMILKTMSKGWGLAGLRVGFMVANASLVQYVAAVQGPFVLSDLNANLAARMLEKEDVMLASVEKTKTIRADFVQFLQNFQVEVFPSEANFIYVKTKRAKEIADGLLAEKIAVTPRADGLRITIGTEEQMEILKQSLANKLL